MRHRFYTKVFSNKWIITVGGPYSSQRHPDRDVVSRKGVAHSVRANVMRGKELRSFTRFDMSFCHDPVRIACGKGVRLFEAIDYSTFGLCVKAPVGDLPPDVGVLEFRNALFSYEIRWHRPLSSDQMVFGIKTQSIDSAVGGWSRKLRGSEIRCFQVNPFKSRYAMIAGYFLFFVATGIAVVVLSANHPQLTKHVPLPLKGFALGRQYLGRPSSIHSASWFTDVFVDGAKGILLWGSYSDLSKQLSEGHRSLIASKVVAAERALFEGDLARALSEATLAIELDSGEPEAYVLRGQAKALSGRVSEALNDFRMSLQFDGSTSRYLSVSDTLRSISQYEAALQILGEGVKRVPDGARDELLAAIASIRSEMQRTRSRGNAKRSGLVDN